MYIYCYFRIYSTNSRQIVCSFEKQCFNNELFLNYTWIILKLLLKYSWITLVIGVNSMNCSWITLESLLNHFWITLELLLNYSWITLGSWVILELHLNYSWMILELLLKYSCFIKQSDFINKDKLLLHLLKTTIKNSLKLPACCTFLDKFKVHFRRTWY